MWSLRRTLLPLVAALAVAAPASAKPQTLHLHFQRVVTGVDQLFAGVGVRTSGNYMLASLGNAKANQYPSRFLLINDATGQRTVLRPGGRSTVSAFGAPWILFWRKGRNELYNIATRKWRPLGCGKACNLTGSSETFMALGSRWLEVVGQTCSSQILKCGPNRYVFYNLRTGNVRHGWPQTDTRIVDLDSPTLVKKLCTPLRAPSGGSVTLMGRIGIVADGLKSYAQRCGSSAHVPIEPGLVSSRTTLWDTPDTAGQLDGLWLPSLRRYTAQLPRHLDTGQIYLDAKRLYVLDQHNVLWGAALSP